MKSPHTKTPHTACRRGKRVRVILRDGTRIRDVFKDRTDKFVFLRDVGKVPRVEIRSFQIDRTPREQENP